MPHEQTSSSIKSIPDIESKESGSAKVSCNEKLFHITSTCMVWDPLFSVIKLFFAASIRRIPLYLLGSEVIVGVVSVSLNVFHAISI